MQYDSGKKKERAYLDLTRMWLVRSERVIVDGILIAALLGFMVRVMFENAGQVIRVMQGR